ncbi:acetylxylan esterase [Demequina sp.]|uniref:acetylxylan esterase n=1 Tax=Demequina sp. TaxID=2050685 RepID=UPI003D0A4EA3
MALFDLPLDDLRTYRPEVAEPNDFDDFWSGTLAQARAFGGEVSLEPVTPGLPNVEVFDMTYPGFNGEPIKAWYSRPASATGNVPVVVQFHGYGGGRGVAFENTFWPSAGYAHVVMDNRGQGSSWGNGGGTPDQGPAGKSIPGFMTRGVEDPHTYYYRRLFTDAVRCIDAARTLPGVDASQTFALGGSQGGASTLAVAGLVDDLVGVAPDVPFMCHFGRAVTITDADPFAEIRRYLAVHRSDIEQTMHTLSYFDGVNFAKRANAPALFSVALMDEICPPSTVFAAFNAYAGGAKDIDVYHFNGHEGGQGHQGYKQWRFVSNLTR